jgi:hypothetical protein
MFSSSQKMSINDVDRILYDRRHGVGSYQSKQSSVYNGLCNASYQHGGYTSPNIRSNSTGSYNTPYNQNGYYYSSSFFN